MQVWPQETLLSIVVSLSSFFSFLLFSFLHQAETEHQTEGIQISKEIVKVSLFAADMILYLRDPKISIQIFLDTINSFSNVAGYKINLQNSVAFIYTSNEQIEKEYMKTIPLTMASKKIKYLGVNL
jgi:hypothetical protein